MKRGTASRVFFGVDKTNEDFGGLLLLSQVTLGKKSGMFDEHKGLCIVDNVLLGKGIARVISVIIRGVSPLSLPDAIADSLSYVKAFGGTEQRNLPDGYTQLEYIESTGTQYINIGVSGDATFIGAAQSTSDTANTSQVLIANSGASAGHWFGVQSPGAGTGYARRWGFGATTSASTTIDGTTKINFELTFSDAEAKQYGTVNNQTLERTTSSSPHTDWYILAGNSSAGYPFYGKVWGLKVKQNNAIVRDFVPAKNSSGVVGMYDLVSGQFFTNQGTGDFVAGPTAVPTPDAPMDIVSNNGVLKARHQSGLPLGYTQVEYIKSNRNIPLGFYTNQNSEIEAKSYKDGAGAQYVYQANSGSTITNNTTAYATDGGGNWRFGNQTISMQFPLNTDIISIQNKNGVWFNNERQGTYTNVNDFTGDVEFRALGVPTPDNPPIRLSYIKHRQNGVLLGHYVSCVAPDNSIGLYDLIGGVFYTNADATITAGSPVSDPVKIYTDGTVETINVHGKNLFDAIADNIVVGYYIDNAGSYISSAPNFYTTEIEVKPNTIYTLSMNDTSPALRIAEYDSSHTFITRTAIASADSMTITTTANTKYIRLSCNVDGDSVTVESVQNAHFQLELGSTATTYAPYYDGGTATAEMLLKVGDYQDVQSIIDGVVTRKIGVKVLDGTENIGKSSQYNGSFFVRNVVSGWGTSNNAQVYCSHFSGVTEETNYAQNKCMILNNAFNMWWASDSTPTIAQFKQWLADQYNAGTPVTIIYPLATPTTESVAGQTLQVQDGDNVLEITQASLNGLELEAQYQAAVSLTIQEVQDANLDPNVEVTIN